MSDQWEKLSTNLREIANVGRAQAGDSIANGLVVCAEWVDALPRPSADALEIAAEMREYKNSSRDWHEEAWLNLGGVLGDWAARLFAIAETDLPRPDSTVAEVVREMAAALKSHANLVVVRRGIDVPLVTVGQLRDWIDRLSQSAPVPAEVWVGEIVGGSGIKVFRELSVHVTDEPDEYMDKRIADLEENDPDGVYQYRGQWLSVHGAPGPAEPREGLDADHEYRSANRYHVKWMEAEARAEIAEQELERIQGELGECHICHKRRDEPGEEYCSAVHIPDGLDRLLGRAEKAERYLRACKWMLKEWRHQRSAHKIVLGALREASSECVSLIAERNTAVKRAEDMEEDRDRALSRLAETTCPELGALRGTEVRLLRDERDALQAEVKRLEGEIESASDLLTQRGLAFATLPRQIVALADEADAANKRAEQIEQEYASVSAALRVRVGKLGEQNTAMKAKAFTLVQKMRTTHYDEMTHAIVLSWSNSVEDIMPGPLTRDPLAPEETSEKCCSNCILYHTVECQDQGKEAGEWRSLELADWISRHCDHNFGRAVDEALLFLKQYKAERDAAIKQTEQIEQEYASVSAALRARVRELEGTLERNKACRKEQGQMIATAQRLLEEHYPEYVELPEWLEACGLPPDYDSPAPEETPEYLCEIRPTAKGTGVFVKADHPAPDDPEMPPCPKCGGHFSPRKGSSICTCFGGPSLRREQWIRHAAENTPCRECGELPCFDDGLCYCASASCTLRNGSATPAEWLDRNKEVKDDTVRCVADNDTGHRTGGDGDCGAKEDIAPDAVERAREACKYETAMVYEPIRAILDHLEKEQKNKESATKVLCDQLDVLENQQWDDRERLATLEARADKGDERRERARNHLKPLRLKNDRFGAVDILCGADEERAKKEGSDDE